MHRALLAGEPVEFQVEAEGLSRGAALALEKALISEFGDCLLNSVQGAPTLSERRARWSSENALRTLASKPAG